MRILLTGASSFTGCWFARELVGAGHQLLAIFRAGESSYQGVRAERVAEVCRIAEPVWHCEFGSETFLDLLASRDCDLLCHHASDTTNYRSWEFDALAATQANMRNIRRVLTLLQQRGCDALIVTGSVFEPYEGLGELDRRAFSPYGLSKHFSYEIARLEADRLGLKLGKFVIANPFGPLEEQRFTSFLAREWSQGRAPTVLTPQYVRDNIHVGLLARAYRMFCERFVTGTTRAAHCAPSGYIEAQGAFALRFAREFRRRLTGKFEVLLGSQTEFSEPMIRVNSETAAIADPEWVENKAWDELVSYYARRFSMR